MYRCSKCGATMRQPLDRCPSCGVLLSGIKCEACGYVGGKSEFINNNHHCPKCNSITYIPGVPRPSTSRPSVPPTIASTPKQPTSGMAIWSLILGILSFCGFSLLCAIPAVILGHIAHRKIESSGGQIRGNGLALAGLILGYINIAMFIILLGMSLFSK